MLLSAADDADKPELRRYELSWKITHIQRVQYKHHNSKTTKIVIQSARINLGGYFNSQSNAWDIDIDAGNSAYNSLGVRIALRR